MFVFKPVVKLTNKLKCLVLSPKTRDYSHPLPYANRTQRVKLSFRKVFRAFTPQRLKD